MSGHAEQQNVIWIDRRGIPGRAVPGPAAGRGAAEGPVPVHRDTGMAGWIARRLRDLRIWYRSRQALHELQELNQADPRLLRDIGLERADLWLAVRHGSIDGDFRRRRVF